MRPYRTCALDITEFRYFFSPKYMVLTAKIVTSFLPQQHPEPLIDNFQITRLNASNNICILHTFQFRSRKGPPTHTRSAEFLLFD